jgi:hypothetical protein
VRRRLFVALLAAGLLLVAGFTAAAVASGGGPFGLLDQHRTAEDTSTGRDALGQATTDESREDESAEEEDASTGARAATSGAVEHKVTICHHTGSKKHPFHPITVDEHALPAHTGHGDTVGPCPAAAASAAPAAKHGKPKQFNGKARAARRSHRSEQGWRNGSDQSHRPGKHGGRKD